MTKPRRFQRVFLWIATLCVVTLVIGHTAKKLVSTDSIATVYDFLVYAFLAGVVLVIPTKPDETDDEGRSCE
jgi:hypothetical protein